MGSRKPRQIGRPPLPPGKARAGMLLVRVTDAERALLEQAAGDMPVSAWIRGIAIAAAARKVRAAKKGEED